MSEMSPSLFVAVARLGEASWYAQDTHSDVWQFALRGARLYEAGATISDLRWLVVKGLALHGEETTQPDDTLRAFRSRSGTHFTDKTCFVLTPGGVRYAARIRRMAAGAKGASQAAPGGVEKGTATAIHEPAPFPQPFSQSFSSTALHVPTWNAIRRELLVGSTVVKRFRVPARNQELVLAAFHEERWPEHIDDPLPVDRFVDPKRRLHDVINRLNRSQINPLIQFRGNGNGNGVYWVLRQPLATPAIHVA